MNNEEIEKKLLEEKNVNLIDILEINNKKYAKTMIVLKKPSFGIEYKYYEITENIIKEISEDKLEETIFLFENNNGNVVY